MNSIEFKDVADRLISLRDGIKKDAEISQDDFSEMVQYVLSFDGLRVSESRLISDLEVTGSTLKRWTKGRSRPVQIICKAVYQVFYDYILEALPPIENDFEMPEHLIPSREAIEASKHYELSEEDKNWDDVPSRIGMTDEIRTKMMEDYFNGK